MQKQIDSIEKDIKDVKEALLGNEYNPNGLVNRLKTIEEYQNRDKKQKWMFAGGAAVLGFIFNLWQKL